MNSLIAFRYVKFILDYWFLQFISLISLYYLVRRFRCSWCVLFASYFYPLVSKIIFLSQVLNIWDSNQDICLVRAVPLVVVYINIYTLHVSLPRVYLLPLLHDSSTIYLCHKRWTRFHPLLRITIQLCVSVFRKSR